MFDDGKLRQLLTHHGSVVFLDVGSGELRHGQAASSPRNVFLGPRDGTWYLVHALADGGLREIRLPPGLTPTSVQLRDSPSDWPQAWSLAPAEGGVFGLLSDGLFLCAEGNGRVTLSRPVLGAWERFELAESPASQALSSLQQEIAGRVARISSRQKRRLPLEFFPEGKVSLDAHGVPFVVGIPTDVVSTAPSGTIRGGLTIVVRDAKYVSHYFHFMEILIGAFAFQMQYLGHLEVDRVVFGSQDWNNPRQNDVQKNLLMAVFGDIQILDDTSYLRGVPSLGNVLCIDRDWSVTRINKFLEPLLPEARVWMPELRRRIHLATQAALRQAPQLASDVRCSYINRKPPRTLTEPVKMRLLDILRDRFGAVREIDFADISWAEQVKHSAQLDLLVGVHGNGLTNLLWLPAHAVAIEIFPKGSHAYDYQMMAEIAGITYFGIEGSEESYIYRDSNRLGAPTGNLNRFVDHLPEAALHNIFDIIEERFSTSDT